MANSSQSARFIEPPRSVQQALREAERAIEEKQFSDAVVRLGDLLQRDIAEVDDVELSGQDFFLPFDAEDSSASRSGMRLYSESLLRKARSMLAALPQQARETYQLRYGPLARKLLSDAATLRDWSEVQNVRRKYFHTEAGYESSLLLAQQAMSFGHALSASLLLDDVVTQPDAVKHLGEGVILLHAATCRLAGRPLPEDLVLSSRSIVVKGESVQSPNASELNDWVTTRFRGTGDVSLNRSSDYKMFGAKPSRNDLAVAEMPIANPRWMKQTVASPRQERAIRKVADELAAGGMLPPPSWSPLRVGNQLLMKTTERLYGVDFRTGKLVWQYPWFAAHDEFEQTDVARDLFGETNGPGDLLSQRVWNDLPYGQITSDGERVFMIDDLGEIEYAMFSPIMGIRGTRPADGTSNTLVALDLATEGKLLWRIGADDEDASSLSNAFFLGPPLPLDGKLYVIAEIAGDIQLLCLDPISGNEVWRQHLVAVETGGIETDAVRRVAGASPTYHEGLLLCPTGAGAMVAIDLVDRIFRWGVNYPRNAEIGHSFSRSGRGIEKEQLLQRWHNGTAIASGDTVLVTPIESDRLFAFDLMTGEERFPKMQRVQQRYLAGIQGDRFLIVSSSGVSAYRLRDGGAPLWKTSSDLIPAGQQVSGRGVFGDGEYLLPLTGNQLIRLSLKDGSVLERRTTRFPLGNLVAVNGQLISQDATNLAVAFGERSLEPRVSLALEQNPDDLEALIRKSEILIQRDSRQEAMKLLDRAREIAPDDDEVHMLSVDAILGMLRDNSDVSLHLIETLETLIDQPAQRVELLALRIRWAIAQLNVSESMKHIIELSDLLIAEAALTDSNSKVVNDPSRFCTLDSWLAARFDELWSKATEQQKSVINERVAEVFSKHSQSATSVLAKVTRHFHAGDASDLMQRQLADRYLENGEFLEVERNAVRHRIPNDETLAGLSSELLITLAAAYANGEMGLDAVNVANILADRNEPEFEERLSQVRSQGEKISAREQWDYKNADIDAAPNIKWLAAQGGLRIGSRMMDRDSPPAKTTVFAGHHFKHWILGKDVPQLLGLRDPLGNTHAVPIESPLTNAIYREASMSGGMLLLTLPTELIGIDLFHLLDGQGDSVIWRRSLSGDGGPIAQRKSGVTPFGDLSFTSPMRASVAGATVPEFFVGPVLGDRVIILQGGDLIAIDLLTSETLWRNSDVLVSGVVVCDDKKVAVVSPAEKKIQFFDLLDGRKLAEKPWQHGQVWTATDQSILCYRDEPGTSLQSIKLVDPFDDRIILQESKPATTGAPDDRPRTCGRIVDQRFLMLLETSGKATIWDLVNGKVIAGAAENELKLPGIEDLHSLHGMRMGDRLILVPSKRLSADERVDQAIVHAIQSKNHFPANAVYAVAVDDGSLLWSREFDKSWGCTAAQPSASPLLMFSRNPVYRDRGASSVRKLDLLALDVRNGNVVNELFDKEIAPSMIDSETEIKVQPLHRRVIVDVSGGLLTYEFGQASKE